MTQGITTSETQTVETCHDESKNQYKTWPELPQWAQMQHRRTWGERLNINEWDGYGRNPDVAPGDDLADVEVYRTDNGWKVRMNLMQIRS